MMGEAGYGGGLSVTKHAHRNPDGPTHGTIQGGITNWHGYSPSWIGNAIDCSTVSLHSPAAKDCQWHLTNDGNSHQSKDPTMLCSLLRIHSRWVTPKRYLDQQITTKRWHQPKYFLHKSHNAPVPYPTLQYFATEMCTCVHISVTKWCIVGYLMHCGICKISKTIYGPCITLPTDSIAATTLGLCNSLLLLRCITKDIIDKHKSEHVHHEKWIHVIFIMYMRKKCDFFTVSISIFGK